MVPEHHSHDPIPEATPPTERVLLYLLSQKTDWNLLFALGNLALRRLDLDGAEEFFQRALELNSEDFRVRTNLAIAFSLQGKIEAAKKNLKEVIIRSPDQIAYFALADILRNEGKREEAFQLLERMLRTDLDEKLKVKVSLSLVEFFTDPEKPEVMLREMLGSTHLDRSQIVEVEKKLSKLLCQKAIRLLREKEFHAGWKCLREVQELTNKDLTVLQYFRDARQIAIESSLLKNAINNLSEKKKDSLFISELVSAWAAEEGLIQDYYSDAIQSERAHWSAIVQKEPWYHFARIRLAILSAYDGDLEFAISELRALQDLIPAKKLTQLGIQKFQVFLSDISLSGSEEVFGYQDKEWEMAGIFHPELAKAWYRLGFTPSEAAAWTTD